MFLFIWGEWFFLWNIDLKGSFQLTKYYLLRRETVYLYLVQAYYSHYTYRSVSDKIYVKYNFSLPFSHHTILLYLTTALKINKKYKRKQVNFWQTKPILWLSYEVHLVSIDFLGRNILKWHSLLLWHQN